MQRQWVGRNVDLNQIGRCAEDFFKERGFITKKTESEREQIISWAPPSIKNVNKAMSVRILGDPNDFVIELVASERTRRLMWLGMLTQLFGGGYILLRGLRLQEALERLENEFWTYMEEKIANLAGSAEHP